MRFFLITEPARGTSIKIDVPDTMSPDDALQWYAAGDDTLHDHYQAWRKDSELQSFADYMREHVLEGDDLTFHDATITHELTPTRRTTEDAFKRWRSSKEFCGDLGKALSDETLQDVPGYLYCGCYIEDRSADHDAPAKYHLLIERSEWWSNDLEELELRLFHTWAWHEGFAGGVAR